MSDQNKRITAIVTAEDKKSELQDDIASLEFDIRVESELPFNSIVVSMENKNPVHRIKSLDSASHFDIEGKGTISKFGE